MTMPNDTPAPTTGLQTEPVAVAAVISALFKATLALLLAFGVHLTVAQIAAVLGAEAPVEVVGWLVFVRSRVTPMVKLPPLSGS